MLTRYENKYMAPDGRPLMVINDAVVHCDDGKWFETSHQCYIDGALDIICRRTWGDGVLVKADGHNYRWTRKSKDASDGDANRTAP